MDHLFWETWDNSIQSLLSSNNGSILHESESKTSGDSERIDSTFFVKMGKPLITMFIIIIVTLIFLLEAVALDSDGERKTSCEIPKDFLNGKLRTVQIETRHLSIVPEGSILQFKCDNQYELRGARRLTCIDGVWFPQLPVCAALEVTTLDSSDVRKTSCEIPKDFVNGKLRTVQIETRNLSIVPEGSVLQFKCDNQYELRGARRVTCKDGVWFPQLPVCAALEVTTLDSSNVRKTSCEIPKDFVNGKLRTVQIETRNLSIVPEGSVLQFKCDNRYQLIGARRVTCKDGVWLPQLPVCAALEANALDSSVVRKTSCEIPKDFANGKLRTVQVEIRNLSIVPEGTILQFKCDNQYELKGARRVTCKDGVWFPQLPVCAALEANALDSSVVRKTSCEIPKDFANGKLRTVQVETRNLSIVPEGTILQFKCDNQYELKGARRVTCKDGVWFPQLPVCAALEVTTLDSSDVRKTSCEIPKDFVNGKLRTVQVETRNLSIVPEGTILQFKCDNQYELRGARRVTCKDGVWFPLLPVCAVPTKNFPESENKTTCEACCETPKNFKNGILTIVDKKDWNLSIVAEFTLLQFKCNDQYVLDGVNGAVCLQGVWHPKFPSCIRRSCLPPPPLKHGRIAHKFGDDEFFLKTEVFYKCDKGYELTQQSALVCVRRGNEMVWQGEKPRCEKIAKCEDPGEDSKGYRKGKCCEYGDILQYSCIEKYKIVGPSAILCTEAGIWNDTRPICQPDVFCDVPNSIPNGQIKGRKSGDFYLPDDEIIIICDEGYTVGWKSDYLYCKRDGEWDEDIPECISSVYCGVPESPENGYIVELVNNKNLTSFPYNSEINFACHPGYRLVGDNWRSCRSYGWTHQNPTCEEIKCPSPGTLENGWTRGNDYGIGKVVQFGCYDGYNLLGSARRTCKENGQWNGEVARCNREENFCPNPGVPIGGTKVGNKYDPGLQVSFFCDPGRILIGSPNRTCQPNGQWSGEEVKCFGEHDYDDNKAVSFRIKSLLKEEVINQEVKLSNFMSTLPENDSTNDAIGYAINFNHPGHLIFVFIFDVSGSVREYNFKKSIQFAKAMVQVIQVSAMGIRVGAITFSNDAHIEFYPFDYTSNEEVLDALDNIEYTKGGTATTSALKIFKEEMIPLCDEEFKRDLKYIVFLMTDGKSNMAGNPRDDAAILKKDGVEIYCVGITGDRQMKTLYEVASSKNKHVFILDGYESVNYLVQEIVNETIDYSKCGVRQSVVVETKDDNNARVVKGKQVVKPWPWMAVIRFKNSNGICGATLIDRKWILTAAHCTHWTNKDNVIIWREKEEFKIKLGVTDLSNRTYLQERSILRYVLHDSYDYNTYDYDIALMELSIPVEYNDFVRPVCLPPPENELDTEPTFYRPGEEAEAVGWGHDKPIKTGKVGEAKPVKVSKQITLTLQKRRTCEDSLENHPDSIFTSQMICAGGKDGGDVCKGDSGGPLMQKLVDDIGEEYWTEVGVISWGIGCAQPNMYGFYTKVSMFVEWIKETMETE